MKKMIFLYFIPLILVFAAVSCSKSDGGMSSEMPSKTGVGGSLARFTIVNERLYAVESDKLKIFNISIDNKPEFVNQTQIGFDIETIFSKDSLLFIGSLNGVYIYDITSPDSPKHLSTYNHIYSCDPVVVSGNYAYSTLSTGGPCSRGLNQMDIIDISNPNKPQRVSEIRMDNPKGLGVADSLLFVCDMGIKVYNISDPIHPEFIRKESIDAFDVIPLEDILLVAAESGLYEYSFTEDGGMTLLSTLYSKN